MNSRTPSFLLFALRAATLFAVTSGFPNPFQRKDSLLSAHLSSKREVPVPPSQGGGNEGPASSPESLSEHKGLTFPQFPSFPHDPMAMLSLDNFGKVLDIFECGSKILFPVQKCFCFALYMDMLPLEAPSGTKNVCLKIFKKKSVIMQMKDPCAKFMTEGDIDPKKVFRNIMHLKKKCLA